jgi:hypothetical protein
VYDFLALDKDDFKKEFQYPDPNDAIQTITSSLKGVTIKKLLLLQKWYATQAVPDYTVWYNLNPTEFNEWRNSYAIALSNPAAVQTTSSTPTPTQQSTTPANTFRQNVKINVLDCPKLKEDQQWRAFSRQLKATAANHDTLEVLDPTYIPPQTLATAFDQKQKFMNNVFFTVH